MLATTIVGLLLLALLKKMGLGEDLLANLGGNLEGCDRGNLLLGGST